LSSALEFLLDDMHAHLPNVEKTLYTVTDEAWKGFEATDNPSNPSQ
jgi:hypothetical protein